MSARRPRFKPAAILTARRTPAAANVKKEEPSNNNNNKLEPNDVPKITAENVPASDNISGNIPSETIYENRETSEIDVQLDKKETTENIAQLQSNIVEIKDIKKETPKPTPNARRIIKPAVCLPARKRKSATDKEGAITASTSNSQTQIEITSKIHKQDDGAFLQSVKLPSDIEPNANIENIPNAIVDSHFKSPFMSPSALQQKRHDNMPAYNPFTDDQQRKDFYLDENIKSPLSPARARQRIRPTPCFGHRRNSIQGSESEDETHKRQRHISTSSTHSNHSSFPNQNSNSTPSRIPPSPAPPVGSGRIRTESLCSNQSDILSTRDAPINKAKRTARSEEFLRIANAKREFSVRFYGQAPDKARLTMFDMIYYNPVTNPMKNPAVKPTDSKDRRGSSVITNATSTSKIKERRSSISSEGSHMSSVHSKATSSVGSSLKAEKETAMPVPQLKLGPNGEIILDEKSLVIETTGEKEARETLANADIVYDDEFSGTSGFYKRNKRTKDWPPEETIRFYRCLHTIGTDFSLMLTLFPKRSRRDLKLKFKKEEKYNGHLINKALLYPKTFNIDDLKVEFEREEKEDEIKRQAWEEAKEQRKKEKKRYIHKTSINHVISQAIRVQGDVDKIYECEFSKAPKRTKKNNTKIKIEEALDNNNESVNNQNKNAVNPVQKIEKLPSLITNDFTTTENHNYSVDAHPSETYVNNISLELQPSMAHPDTITDVVPAKSRNNSSLSLNLSDMITNEDLYEHNLLPMQSCDEDIFDDVSCMDYIAKNAPENITAINNQDILNMEIIFDNINNEPVEKSYPAPTSFDTVQIVSAGNGTKYEILTQSENLPFDENSCRLEMVFPCYSETANESDNIQSHQVSQDVSIASTTSPTQFCQIQESGSFCTGDDILKQEIVVKSKDEESEGENEDDDDDEDEDDDDDDGDDDEDGGEFDMEGLADSLVVVARVDPNDDSKVIHEVFYKSPETGTIHDEPLDLSPEIIARIIAALSTDSTYCNDDSKLFGN